jgi:hypothetical protein
MAFLLLLGASGSARGLGAEVSGRLAHRSCNPPAEPGADRENEIASGGMLNGGLAWRGMGPTHSK